MKFVWPVYDMSQSISTNLNPFFLCLRSCLFKYQLCIVAWFQMPYPTFYDIPSTIKSLWTDIKTLHCIVSLGWWYESLKLHPHFFFLWTLYIHSLHRLLLSCQLLPYSQLFRHFSYCHFESKNISLVRLRGLH